MPKPIAFANAFTAREVAEISGLSIHMVGYLANASFLLPSYERKVTRRGSTRYYSYRDVAIARLMSRLCDAGIELKRLKKALVELQNSKVWESLGREAACALLVTDGVSIFIEDGSGSMLDLTRGGQLAFAFVMDLMANDAELRDAMDSERLQHFTYAVRPLRRSAAAD